MTILILDELPQKIAEALDDKSLSKMIKSIAQVLCNVHYEVAYWNDRVISVDEIPLQEVEKTSILKWRDWASGYIENYRHLVKMGLDLCEEYLYRFDDYEVPKKHLYQNIIAWAQQHEQELPIGDEILPIYKGEDNILTTTIPIVIPSKFKNGETHTFWHLPDVIDMYRNYYRHILEKRSVKICKECKGTGYGLEVEMSDHFHILFCKKCDGEKLKLITPTWTRRSKPEWL